MKLNFFPWLLLAGLLQAEEPAPRPAPEAFEKGNVGQAQDWDEPVNAPRHVQVTLEYIEVSQAEATRLLYKEKLGKDGTKLREELQALIDTNKATLFETLLTTSRSGQRGTTESIREVIYPTEVEPSSMPSEVKVDKEVVNNLESTKALAALVSPNTPTAFETRNTGGTLEIEPTIGDDNQIIDLRIVPEIVFETPWRRWNIRKDVMGNESAVEVPYFYSIRTNTALTVADGMPQLLAVFTPKGADDKPDPTHKLIAIVTADIVKVKLKPSR